MKDRKHKHYFKDVKKLSVIDVYRVLELFNVTDPCVAHAVKKLLVSGGRGQKNEGDDIQEAIDSLVRWQEMRVEDLEELVTPERYFEEKVKKPHLLGFKLQAVKKNHNNVIYYVYPKNDSYMSLADFLKNDLNVKLSVDHIKEIEKNGEVQIDDFIWVQRVDNE